MAVVVFYFVCVTSTSVVFFVIGSSVNDTGAPAPWMLVVIESLMTLDQANHALNFCLYGLTSPEFRLVFKSIFTLKIQAAGQ